MATSLPKAHPSTKIHIFEGRQAEVNIAMFKLGNGYSYARIETKAIGGESGAAGFLKGASHEDLMSAIRSMQSMDHIRECGFAAYNFDDHGQIDWDAAETGNPWARGEGSGLMRRISSSNIAHHCDQIAEALDMIAARGGMLGWSANVDGAPIDLRAWGAAAQRRDHLLDLGAFECSSGTLWVSDPCYDLAEGEGKDVLEGAKGSWHAYSTRRGCGNWGDRPAQILIAREGEDPLAWLAGSGAYPWVDAGIDCGVDSGQAGFFDIRAYGEPGGENEAFYDACSDLTLGFMGGGVVCGGAACRSGDGDGGYPVEIARAPDGSLAAARILFYEPRPEEIHAWGAAFAAREAALIASSAAGGIAPPRHPRA